MTSSSPPLSSKSRWRSKPAWVLYIAGCLVLFAATFYILSIRASLNDHPDNGNFSLEVVQSEDGYPGFPIVNVTRDQLATLPGNLLFAFEQAKQQDRFLVDTTVDERGQIMRVFRYNEDPQHPLTLVRYEGTLFSYGWTVH